MAVVRPPSRRRSPTTVYTSKADANIALPVVAGVWTDVDPGGNAAARPLDVVIPACQVGDVVKFTPAAWSPSTAGSVFMDVGIYVNGTLVRRIGDTTLGVPIWFTVASAARAIAGSWPTTVQQGDLSADGSLRLRFMAANAGTTARALNAGSGYITRFEGSGPFA